jgi:hypothetical protein
MYVTPTPGRGRGERGDARGDPVRKQLLASRRQRGRRRAEPARRHHAGHDQRARRLTRGERPRQLEQRFERAKRARRNEHGPVRHRRRGLRARLLAFSRRKVERGVLAQDGRLEAPELFAGLQPQLVQQPAARVSVGLKRVGLARAAVQRKHQLAMHALAQRMLRDQRLELAHQLRVAPARQLGVDARLKRRPPQLLQAANLDLREPLVREIGERRPAPECERLAQRPRGRGRVAVAVARLGQQRLEALEVKLARLDAQQVTRRPRDHTLLTQLLAQPRHIHLDALGDRDRRCLSPQLVDQPVGADDLVGVQQQDGQERPLLTAAERERRPVLDNLQWPKHSELHHDRAHENAR